MFGEEIAVKAKIVNYTGLSSHADRDHLLSWIADFKAPKPQHVFVVHGDREVAPYFAKSVEELGFTAQYTEVWDLAACVQTAQGYLPERRVKSFDGQTKTTPAYERLVSVTQMLTEAVKRSRSRDNKSLANLADQLRTLLDKWEA